MAGLHPQYGKTWQRCDVYAESVVIFSDVALRFDRSVSLKQLKNIDKI